MWLVTQCVPTTPAFFRVLESWGLTGTHLAPHKACCVQEGTGLGSCCCPQPPWLRKAAVKIAFAHRDSADFEK